MSDEIAAQKKRQAQLDAQAVGANFVRGVEGKFSDIRNNTNWVTIPNIHERGKFLKATPDGMAFEIETKTRMAGEGGSYWGWALDRVVVVTNCPPGFKVRGQSMPPMRLFGVGTSEHFEIAAPIYDYGVLPKPVVKTNTPSVPATKP